MTWEVVHCLHSFQLNPWHEKWYTVCSRFKELCTGGTRLPVSHCSTHLLLIRSWPIFLSPFGPFFLICIVATITEREREREGGRETWIVTPFFLFMEYIVCAMTDRCDEEPICLNSPDGSRLPSCNEVSILQTWHQYSLILFGLLFVKIGLVRLI